MCHEPPELPDGFDGEVRLFPLPEFVCFPFAVQPMHIFESRYREMLEDALRGDQLLCMATLEPGYQADYYSRPPVSPHVCVGRVANHQRRDDGTYDLLLVGFWRARIAGEISPVRSYRRANVQVFTEEIINGTTLTNSVERHIVKQLARQLPPAGGELRDAFLGGKMSLNGLTDILAFHLPFDRNVKLAFLAERDAMKRAKMLVSAIPRLPREWRTPSGAAEDEFPPPFSGN